MLIDLHTHTMHLSTDSGLTLERLLTRAQGRGLDGVCLTEHNALWNQQELEEKAAHYHLAVFRGMEINTEYGHILAFGLPGYRLEMIRLERLVRLVEEHQGALVLPHPDRRTAASVLAWKDVARDFHAIETFNGGGSNGYSTVAPLAANLGLGTTGGSDAHSSDVVGSCVTRFQVPIHTEEELVRELRAKRVEGVYLGESLDGEIPVVESPPAIL